MMKKIIKELKYKNMIREIMKSFLLTNLCEDDYDDKNVNKDNKKIIMQGWREKGAEGRQRER